MPNNNRYGRRYVRRLDFPEVTQFVDGTTPQYEYIITDTSNNVIIDELTEQQLINTDVSNHPDIWAGEVGQRVDISTDRYQAYVDSLAKIFSPKKLKKKKSHLPDWW